jgi:cytochrome c-type biogenesis protein
MHVTVSFPLALAAGLASFLSPCVLPVVPAYLVFVTGLSLDELRAGTVAAARRTALVQSVLFVLGFAAVFMTMGWAATSLGRVVGRALPWLDRAGGVLLMALGLYLAGLVRAPGLAREIRVHLTSRPSGAVGSLVLGIAFGAGWTPCIGPVLASILLYASVDTTRTQGTLLLGTYALGLGLPFVVASVAFNAFVTGTERVRRWSVGLERAAGVALVIVGLAMVTGGFARVAAFLAGLGQLINLETS